MSRPGWKAVTVLTVFPVVAAFYAAELLLTFPPAALVRHPRFYNAARFDAVVAARKHRQLGKLVYPVVGTAFHHRKASPAHARLSPLPLAPVARASIVLCNETGTDLIITSDRFGFSNPDSIWNSRPADVALIGDSFVHGECVGPEGDIASHLRSRFVVFNAGLSGAGPLTELAVLREYVSELRPRLVFWLFFEGNDIEDLAAEKSSAVAPYLDSGFRQDLVSRRETVDSVARFFLDSVVAHAAPSRRSTSTLDVVLLRRLRGLLGLSLRERPAPPPPDYAAFGEILHTASSAVKAWGGRLVFVYLPDRRRFSGEGTTVSAHHDLDDIRSGVLAAARREGLSVIDLADRFAKEPSPTRWWRSPRSHYTASAYEAVATEIVAIANGLMARRAAASAPEER